MTKPLIPTKPGAYWVALDDGEKVVETALLKVSFYRGLNSFEEGFVFEFVDDTGRKGTTTSGDIRNPIIRPGVDIVLACRSISYDNEVRVTWLGEAKPPRNAPKVGAYVEEAERG